MMGARRTQNPDVKAQRLGCILAWKFLSFSRANRIERTEQGGRDFGMIYGTAFIAAVRRPRGLGTVECVACRRVAGFTAQLLPCTVCTRVAGSRGVGRAILVRPKARDLATQPPTPANFILCTQ